MKKRKLIVISEDALVYEDTKTLMELPTFSSIWGRAAFIDRVKSIYPTVTYPCHTTMQTGLYPDRHGVVNNEQAILGERSSKWVHFRRSIAGETIFDWAKAAGMTTAAVFWPVTGCDPAIDYLVDEYWPQEGESTIECFRASGSSDEVIEKVVQPNRHLVEGKHRLHPYADEFVNACACSMIREFRPDLLMIHPANIDGYRHQSGVFSPKVTHALHEIDMWLCDLMKACEDAGVLEDTDFVITSDHGQMNITRTVSPNVVLAENGLIDVDGDGKIKSMRAFCKSTALSSLVYVTDPTARDEVYALLCGMRDEGIYGISRVFTREEAQTEERLAGDFEFVLESDGFSSFTNDWVRPIVRSLDTGDYRFGRATHGHLPEKGPQPTLIAFGPHIKAGAHLAEGRIVDDAPTFARILGIEPPIGLDGRAVTEIIRDEE